MNKRAEPTPAELKAAAGDQLFARTPGDALQLLLDMKRTMGILRRHPDVLGGLEFASGDPFLRDDRDWQDWEIVRQYRRPAFLGDRYGGSSVSR